MRKGPFLLLGLILALAATAPAQTPPRANGLPAPVQQQLRMAGLPAEALGVVVRRLSDGATVLAHQADRSLQPASTLKLLTSLVALETLGPAYRGRTELRMRGRISDGVLTGELYLRGLGDVDFDAQALERMLHIVRNHGVRELRGDLVLDLSLFRPARADMGAPPFDEAPEFRYNVIPDSLGLNTNLVHLDMVSSTTALNVALTPPLEKVSVDADMILVDRSCEDWEDGWALPAVERQSKGNLRIRLRGQFPVNCTASTSINVIDRVAFADRLFRALWRRVGGTFHGRTREGETAPDAKLVAQHRSRPLTEMLHDINKRSDNPVTRVVYLTLGALAEPPSPEPTARRADAQVRAWLESRGIDPRGLVLENGSGLSRHERITPAQLAAVLKAGASSAWAPEFLASMPVVAVDGSMRKRLKDSPAAAQSRIKTGTLRDVTAVAGYVKDDAGETHIVVAMVNHPLARRQVARPVVDSLIDWVARRNGSRAEGRPGVAN